MSASHNIIETARPERETWPWTRSPAVRRARRSFGLALELAAILAAFLAAVLLFATVIAVGPYWEINL